MTVQKAKVDSLIPYDKNVRIHTKRNLDAIKKSLNAFGQTKPIVVRKETREILCGNGTYQAAVALGWEQINCHFIDIDEQRAKALMIADNRSSDLSQMDEKAVFDLLQDFDQELLDITCYDDKQLDNMLKFQSGQIFEEEKKQKNEKKKKESYEAVSSDDQVSFILFGYPFVLADPVKIKELKDLMDKFTTQNIQIRCETTFQLWDAIKDVLVGATGITNNSQNDQPVDMSIETDRL